MTKYTTVLASLLSPLSRSVFESEVKAYQADKWSKTLSTFSLFKTLLYGQLAGCFSVRDILASLEANSKHLYHAGMHLVKRSTLCDAMAVRNHKVFQGVFHQLVECARKLSSKTGKKFSDPLRILDTTIIPVCLSLVPWARFRKTKGAVKIHTLLDGRTLLPFDALFTAGNIHDSERMLHLCQESGVIYGMDRGYVDYKSLYCLELQGSFFVTRMKSNGAFTRIKIVKGEEDGAVISDELIQLTGPKTKYFYPKPLRKVRYYDKESGRTYDFITNALDKEAAEIAAIYKERWQIELFFKWIKQNLKIKTFWGTSENAVSMQLWTALILTILVWLNKTMHGINITAHRILQKLKTALLNKGSLVELCAGIPPPFKESSLQPLLAGFL